MDPDKQKPEAPAASSGPRPNLTAIRNAARLLIASGLAPIPLPPRDGKLTKAPSAGDWPNLELKTEEVDAAFGEGCNIGLRLEVLTDVDLDAPEARLLAQYFLKPTPARWGRDTSRNSHHLYKVENSLYEEFIDPLTEGPERTLLEIRHGHGHQSMIPPSVHPDGELVRWETSGPFNPETWDFYSLRRSAGKIAAIILLMRYLKSDSGVRHWVWFYLGGAMARAEWTREEALFFVDVATRACRDEQPGDRRSAVESSYEEGKTELAGLKKLEDYLPKPVVRKLAQWLDLRRAKSDPLDLTDDANAQSLCTEHGEDIRYLPNEGKGGLWVYWNDVTWRRDRMSYVTHLAAGTLKKKSDQLTASSRDARFIEKVRRELLNMPGISGALDRLSCYPEIAVPSSAFDADPWLIGLQNGVYNLRLDRLEEGAREHLVSRQMTAFYRPDAACPRWLTCLKRAQPDGERRAFLQRVGGACLLGMQTEHGFIFNYGKGANFKTVYSEMLRREMGDDYAATPNEELFFNGNQEVPRNYLADIHGMRLLVTSEKKENSDWNIEFMKRLLGGQALNACRKYCESFSFIPTTRVIAAANNKPRLNELDEATRRRFLLVPWEVVIPSEGDVLSPGERDPEAILRSMESGARMPFEQLMALLLEERDGYLNWLLEGLRDFLARGLRLDPPKSVVDATEEYFEDEDLAGRFVKDWTKVVPVPATASDAEVRQLLQQRGTPSERLHLAFTVWSRFGKHPWGRQKVSRRLEKVDGVRSARGTGNRLWFNLVLTSEAEQAVYKAEQDIRDSGLEPGDPHLFA